MFPASFNDRKYLCWKPQVAHKSFLLDPRGANTQMTRIQNGKIQLTVSLKQIHQGQPPRCVCVHVLFVCLFVFPSGFLLCFIYLFCFVFVPFFQGVVPFLFFFSYPPPPFFIQNMYQQKSHKMRRTLLEVNNAKEKSRRETA